MHNNQGDDLSLKVLLIDDHRLFVDGMRLVLDGFNENLMLFDADSLESALPIINEHPELDLILLDLGLPGLSDIEAVKLLRQKIPSTPLVVLSSNDDGEKVQQVLNLGAQGYIPKSTHSDLVINALRLVLSGGIYIPPEILSQVSNAPSLSPNSPINTADIPLTSRQCDVLQEMAHGNSNKEIAKILNMAEATVRVHIAAILKELNASNRTRAVNIAIQKGWVQL